MQPFQTELNLVHDPQVRAFTEAALAKAPAYFWTVASSTSGKTHPPDERGPGGRVLHTKRVVRVVVELCRIDDHPQMWTDHLVAAALIHDLVVNGTADEPMPHNWREHDAGLRPFLGDTVTTYGSIGETVLSLCESHMGRWAFHPDWRPVPGSLGHLLHIADVIASREWATVEPLANG